ncbi:maltase A1-like [Contarinia nasturtii]|uniref:maltase A1-like n=1 Tax=Contarinia nasturtii TaxID=265458 RepID=UPI0012D3C558|nr:maltase A1-like [Contarinia nasturtii]
MNIFQFICVVVLCVAVDVCRSMEWYDNSVIYHIYPRSFKDSNGDGIGDIRGIIEELDYLKELGVDAAWLSPTFKSPMADFGYDIENYYEIDPVFGTMKDMEDLFREAKKRNLKIILDFVPNHTSEKCDWFKKSVKREGKYTDYYIWADGKNNNTEPPNNWVSRFYGHAWKFNKERNQWYYHVFAKEQPDLNLRNPLVIKELTDVLEFWMKKGANGFRMDAVDRWYESEHLLDEPLSKLTNDSNLYDYTVHIYTRYLPEVYDLLYKFRDVAEEFEKKMKSEKVLLMTEALVKEHDFPKLYGNSNRKGAQMPINFLLLRHMDRDSSAHHVKKIIDDKIASTPVGARINWHMNNHDNPRSGSTYGERRLDSFIALLLTLPGNVVTYYGEEIGMSDDRTIPYSETLDPLVTLFDPTQNWIARSRDAARTPMQWDGSKRFAGFMPTNGSSKPWLPVNKNYKKLNVVRQRKLVRSTLNFYKKLVQLRKRPAFASGTFTSIVINDSVFAYVRELPGQDTYWVLINFDENEEQIDMSRKRELGKNMPKLFKLVAVNPDSQYTKGQIVKADEIVIRKYDAIILKSADKKVNQERGM